MARDHAGLSDHPLRAGGRRHWRDAARRRAVTGIFGGFVTVLGIAARNGIMLVSHYRHLEEAEAEPFSRQLILRGAEERLTPILMTALATGLALVPLVTAGNLAGTRDRVSDGGRHPGWVDHLNVTEPVFAAADLSRFW